MEKKVIMRNIACSLLLQIVTTISGLIVPKIILSEFGSNTNGLINSVTQFLNYIELLEGGLSSVIMASLYKPLHENNALQISSTIRTASNFFRRIGLIFIVYMLGVAIVYPLVIDTGFSYGYSFALVIVLGMHLVVQYFFAITYKLLLKADRKLFYVSITQIVILVVNIGMVYIGARYFHDILALKFLSATVFFIQPILYNSYVKKHYAIDKNAPENPETLKNRWDGFGINLAYFIHTNTDVVVLTTIASLKQVSVYSVYAMVIFALKRLVLSISSSIEPSFGKVLVSGDHKRINQAFDDMELGIDLVTSVFFICGLLLVTPFVSVYTKNITDVDYYQPTFGVVLTIAEMLYCFRMPFTNATYAAGRFKETAIYAYIEAILNIVISIILVFRWGIIGVAIGTLVSIGFRLFAHAIDLRKAILYRPLRRTLKAIGVFGVSTLFISLISISLFNFECATWMQWVVLGIKVFSVTIVILLIATLVFYREEIQRLLIKRIVKGKAN